MNNPSAEPDPQPAASGSESSSTASNQDASFITSATMSYAQSADGPASKRRPNTPRGQSDIASYESDWQIDSILRFARQTSLKLNERAQAADNATAAATHEALSSLVQNFMAAIQAYYRKGINLLGDPREFRGLGVLHPERKPATHRQMIEIIGEEWTRLMSFVTSAHFLADQRNERALDILYQAIQIAEDDLNLEAVQQDRTQHQRRFVILPHFGRHFELVTFRYAPAITVLGIPVASLYNPWDWSFIWHETAGVYIESQRGAATGIVQHVYDELRAQVAQAAVWQQWFDHYRAELEQLTGDNDQAVSADNPPADFILQNWAEELVEDAVGVLCLGEAMTETLESILRRYYDQDISFDEPQPGGAQAIAGDVRHPPIGLRAAVAESLLEQERQTPKIAPSQGEAALAARILSRKELLVRRTFKDSEDRERQEQATPADKLRLKIAEATRAFRRGEMGGHEVRSEIYEADIEPWQQMNPPDGRIADLDKTTFWRYTFSAADQGTANASSDTQNHTHPQGGGNATVTIVFKNVDTAHGKHFGKFAYTHDRNNTL
jgi:hypothetical protein